MGDIKQALLLLLDPIVSYFLGLLGTPLLSLKILKNLLPV
jgi:hypothetical protein